MICAKRCQLATFWPFRRFLHSFRLMNADMHHGLTRANTIYLRAGQNWDHLFEYAAKQINLSEIFAFLISSREIELAMTFRSKLARVNSPWSTIARMDSVDGQFATGFGGLDDAQSHLVTFCLRSNRAW